jgi:hypothetical protein
VGGEKDGDALLGDQVHERASQRLGGHWIQSGRGLVQKDQVGSVEEGTRYSQLPLHAEAEATRRLLPPVPQAELAQKLFRPGPALAPRHVPDPAVELEVVLNPEPRVEPRLVEQRSGAAANLVDLGGHVVAENGGPPRCGTQKSEQ